MDGDVPYVFVFKKFVGSNDSSNLLIELGNPSPTFLRFGINCSSLADGSPAPNWIVVVLVCVIFDTNLFEVFKVFKRYVTVDLNWDNSL